VTSLPKTSKPAERALASIGVRDLEGLSRHSGREIAELHGMGPKGVRILKAAMAVQGLSFKA
jgi:hypothetical protein